MANDDNTVRNVAWSEVFPWFNLFRTFRLAIGFRAMLLGAVGLLLMLSGWSVLGHIFLPAGQQSLGQEAGACPWRQFAGEMPDAASAQKFPIGDPVTEVFATNPLTKSWLTMSQPLLQTLEHPGSLRSLACMLLSGVWSLAVWAFFGGCIARIGAVQLACEERIGWMTMFRFAQSKWLGYFAAPLFPLIGIVMVAIPVALLGILLRVGLGILGVAVIWPVLLVGGLVMALLLVGLIFGWPLMWATISAEGTDSFDALSRCYAYVFQRPLHYLFYAVIAAAFGALGWWLVSNVAWLVVWMTYFAASWGAGNEAIEAIRTSSPQLGALGKAGAWLIHCWVGCVRLLAAGFIYSYFWIASTAIYFLLRRDVDATELDEVYLGEEKPSAPLAPLKTDAAGAPVAPEKSGDGAPPASPLRDEE